MRRSAGFTALLALLLAYIAVRLGFDLPWLARVPLLAALAALFWLMLRAAVSHFGQRGISTAIAWASLWSIGALSSLLVLTVLRDAALVVASLLGQAGALRQPTAAAVPLLALAASLVGLWNARRTPTLRRVDVPITGLPAALQGFTFVQISDLHIGPTIRRDFVERVVNRVNEAGADAVVLTGDLVDGTVEQLASHIAPLARLQARYGLFAVTGNHEYYAGAPAWIATFRSLGLRVLMNEHVTVERGGARLLLAGVTDFNADHFEVTHRSNPAAAAAGAPPDARPRVLLAHQPRSAAAAAAAGFDLQISGHTHGGQFVPWNFFVPMQQPYVAGLHRHAGTGLQVYVSRGTGYWGPPMRLGAPSEITAIRLVAA